MFEKIHPFSDGNGRVGRLLLQTILATGEYHFNWLLSFEEILNERKAEYYAHLDISNPTRCIEFMLGVLLEASENVMELFTEKKFLIKKMHYFLDAKNCFCLFVNST